MRQMRTLASAIAATLLVASGTSYAQGPGAPQSVPVDVINVVSAPQTITIELPGRSHAYQQAEVRPQVNGLIESRLFVEGGKVTAGQSLYQIDDALYEATLVSAKAQLEQAKAQLASTKATADRYRDLVKTNAVSQQEFDQAEAAYLQAQAGVAVAKAAIHTAEINLQYTKVEAPISGYIGKSAVTPGALVGAGQAQALAMITQLDPINVDMVQSSAQMLRLKQRLASGDLVAAENDAITLILEDGSVYPHTGKLQFSEVTVDQGMGSVALRAEFPNPDGLLMPGMFVRAQVNVGTAPNAILVPQKAVSRTPKGQGMAMVVSKDNTVEARPVQTAEVINNQWLITDGLKDGDQVIVNGLQKIRPGAPVAATEITTVAAQ
ncbi:efflux RND transporter periplasmic adaptor subunit [Ferrimonas senticii]|uniref:efflux RND transporter periplasmic adaptor subunit n=1 Tax=Ferrimonas senticii TaxID=394566 RepID=UPI0003F8F4F9|nr:efflux RND transporter periplasmic adaptor subunit [Ferrimonas senticii]